MVFNVLLVVLPLSALIWFFIDTPFIKDLLSQDLLLKPISTPEGHVNMAYITWTSTSKTIAFMSDIVGLLPLFLSLFSLKLIFKNYRRGEIFTSHNAKSYGKLGFLLFLDALITKPVSDSLMIIGVTFANPPGHRYLTLGFGTLNIQVLFCGIIVMVVSWIMLEASKLQDDQKYTV